MTTTAQNIKEEFDLIDLVSRGSKSRSKVRTRLIVGTKTRDNDESGLLLDTNELFERTDSKYLSKATQALLSVDTSNYVLSLQLYDVDGTPLGDPSSVDLPIESLVKNGYYDSETKTIILVLESGDEIEIPVADLISGLQPEITQDNKLSSDLVDDTGNIHLFVSSSEKSTWTGKQDAITSQSKLSSDLVDDTNKSHRFVTAAQLTIINNMTWYEGL